MKRICILINFLFAMSCALAQSNSRKNCYQDSVIANEKVFDRMEIYPTYKTSVDDLNQLLIGKINSGKILSSADNNVRFMTDTFGVEFVVTKDRKMSRLQIFGSKTYDVLERELRAALVSSACNWLPGESSGKFLNSKFTNQLVITIDRRGKFLSIKVEWLESFAK